ncbi:hypothetical protein MGN70_014755 [Eutypa lata]|nr:hypothetical protein MGN70_014755 [Eutypa lata]
MIGANSAQVITQLSTALGGTCKVTLETPYGLAIEGSPDNTLTAKLNNDTDKEPSRVDANDTSPVSTSDQDTSTPRYKYRIFPDFGTDFLWYDTSWPGNPVDEYPVDCEELPEHYGDSWYTTYDSWVEKYTQAFRKQEADLGSGKHPFPDMEERKAWVLEGLLLATWLCLQSDVLSVQYSPDSKKIVLERHSIGTTLKLFLEELDQYLT